MKAHDEKNDAGLGDTVRVVECRPISKEKSWRLEQVIERLSRKEQFHGTNANIP